MNRLALCFAAALTLTACSKAPVVSTPPVRCSALVPDSWSEGVEGVAVPSAPATEGLTPVERAIEAVKSFAAAYTAQTGQLEKANGRTADTISIISRCEELINAARLDADD